MDFLIKQSEPFLPFDMLTPHTIIFPMPQQPNEELMVSCEPCPSPAPPDVNCAPPMPEVEIKRAPSATPAPSSAPDFEPMSVDGDRMNDPQPNVINRDRDDLKNVLPPHLVIFLWKYGSGCLSISAVFFHYSTPDVNMGWGVLVFLCI
jgi:hypothetical protein